MNLRRAIILGIVLFATMGLAPAGQIPAMAVASGCTTAKPTWVGGHFWGSDGRAINAHIGVGLKDKNGIDVLEDGSPRGPGEGYSFIERLNPTVPATGTTDPSAVRVWGRCVAANVTRAFIEIYPKRPASDPLTAPTDYSRYGLGSYYFLRVTVGARLDVLLRTPLIYQLGGNTGGVQGYITRGGRPVPPEYITRVRAFTTQPGATCGVEGMAAIANKLLTGPSGRTYYLVDFLAAGQCGVAYQTYNLRVTCGPPACGSVPVLVIKKINVVRGRWPRVDVAF
jgi:hypothetical protein